MSGFEIESHPPPKWVCDPYLALKCQATIWHPLLRSGCCRGQARLRLLYGTVDFFELWSSHEEAISSVRYNSRRESKKQYGNHSGWHNVLIFHAPLGVCNVIARHFNVWFRDWIPPTTQMGLRPIPEVETSDYYIAPITYAQGAAGVKQEG